MLRLSVSVASLRPEQSTDHQSWKQRCRGQHLRSSGQGLLHVSQFRLKHHKVRSRLHEIPIPTSQRSVLGLVSSDRLPVQLDSLIVAANVMRGLGASCQGPRDHKPFLRWAIRVEQIQRATGNDIQALVVSGLLKARTTRYRSREAGHLEIPRTSGSLRLARRDHR